MIQAFPLTRDRLAQLLPGFADASHLHAWSYAAAAAGRLGAESLWLEVRDGSHVMALANARLKRLPFGLGGVALVSGGPLVRRRDSEDPADWLRAFEASASLLIGEFVRRRGMTLRIHPALGAPEWNAAQAAALRTLGFTPSALGRTRRTILKRIDGTEEDLRRSFDQKWRNQLNAAGRRDFATSRGSTVEFIDRMRPLYVETGERKGFVLDLDLDFFRSVVATTATDEPVPTVTIVSHEGRDLSAHLGYYIGDTAVYVHGGTSEDGRSLKAAYWAQWQAILHARDAGCTWYDTGGIDPDGNPGVYHFKSGLSGVDTSSVACDLSGAGLRGRFSELAEWLRFRVRNRGGVAAR